MDVFKDCRGMLFIIDLPVAALLFPLQLWISGYQIESFIRHLDGIRSPILKA
jgi:hypothetical protein